MKEKNENIYPIIEALLFTWGDPLDLLDMAKILEIPAKKLERLLLDYIDNYQEENRGLRIEKRGNLYQLGTRPEYNEWISKLNRSSVNKNLSNAALETLAIIAYRQPVIKLDLEGIRGVKCDTAVYNLLDKGLIEEQGRLDRIGRPILYGTTDLFLKVFGLKNLDDLPELEENLNLEQLEENDLEDLDLKEEN